MRSIKIYHYLFGIIITIISVVSCSSLFRNIHDRNKYVITSNQKKYEISTFCNSLTTGNRILELEGWNVWGCSPIWGEDGKVHVFFSRWPGGHNNWLVNSEIAHAVANQPEGPYEVTGTVLSGRGGRHWDAHTVHNPTIQKVGDKYALFYIGNNLTVAEKNNAHHASTQRIGLAVSDSLNGKWKRISDESPILDVSSDADDWDSFLTSNPALLNHPNGEYWLYYKAWDKNNDNLRKIGLAIARDIEGPYVKYQSNPIVSFSSINQQVEDAYVFLYNNKFYMILRDMGVIHPNVGLILESDDGINWAEPKLGYESSKYYFGGEVLRFERPQVLMKEGTPTHLFLSLMGGKYNTSSGSVLKIDASKFK